MLQSSTIYPNPCQQRDLDRSDLFGFQWFFVPPNYKACRFLSIWYSITFIGLRPPKTKSLNSREHGIKVPRVRSDHAGGSHHCCQTKSSHQSRVSFYPVWDICPPAMLPCLVSPEGESKFWLYLSLQFTPLCSEAQRQVGLPLQCAVRGTREQHESSIIFTLLRAIHSCSINGHHWHSIFYKGR